MVIPKKEVANGSLPSASDVESEKKLNEQTQDCKLIPLKHEPKIGVVTGIVAKL